MESLDLYASTWRSYIQNKKQIIQTYWKIKQNLQM